MKHLIILLLILCPTAAAAEADTLLLPEVVVASSKENMPLREQPLSSSALTRDDLRQTATESIKDLSGRVPGLFIPAYGSRLTTSVYLRGVGSRTGTPAVGLYVDGVPVVSPAAYDFDIADVERVEVMRGPQSTLYGRGTMGGLLRITTKDPLQYAGSDITLAAATYNRYRVSATHYHRLSPRFGFMGGVSYNHLRGFFVNQTLHRRADRSDDLQARLRFTLRPSHRVRLDLTATYEYSHEGAYPYARANDDLGVMNDDLEGNAPLSQKSTFNIQNSFLPSYARHLLRLGLTAEHTWERVVVSNVLGLHTLKDDMQMDQDFTAADIYRLRQRQRQQTLSEEIVLKTRPKAWAHWQMTTGVAAFYQWLTTTAPVTFGRDGLDWLNGLINTSANKHMPQVAAGPMTMDFAFADSLQGTELPFHGRFKTPTLSAAVYHQSTLTDLFNIHGLSLTLGLRLDYERLRLSYASSYAFTHTYQLAGHLTSPFMNRDIEMVPKADYDVARTLTGRLDHDYLQLLPRFSLQYKWLYATVSRGYRSGGYNIQMFSEVLQSLMQTDMMTDVRDATLPVLQAQPMVPEATKQQVTDILSGMARTAEPDIRALCLYKPEYAWNYELGTHLNFFARRLLIDAAVFHSEVRDQQTSRMAEGGLGRVTANIGRSRTTGCEATITALPTTALTLHAAYGYTHSRLSGGLYVPFTPRHTFALGARYEWQTRRYIDRIALSADYHGLGPIYWTEANNARQDFYGTLQARLTLSHQALSLSLYAVNLTRQRYQAFYFETRGQGFEQKGEPFQAGIELRLHL